MKGWVLVLLSFVVLVSLALSATPVSAADIHVDDSVVISSDDVIDDNVYIISNRIVINGTINGDAVCIGNDITITGKIEGSVFAIGNTIEITGEVSNSVRMAGANLTISGDIGGDVIVAGDDIRLTDSAVIDRDLIFAGNSIDIDSLINDGILGIGSSVFLSSIIGDDVDLTIEQLTITSGALIRGDLSYTSENEAIIESGATILGGTFHDIDVHRFDSPKIDIWWEFVAFLMTLITGIVLILIAPRRFKAVADSLKERPLSSLGWGAVFFFAAPIVFVLFFVTVLGIPVGILGIIAYLAAIYLSQIAVGLFLGYWLLGYFRGVDSRGMLIGAFTIGFALLTVIKLIPFIGWILWLATVVFGIGAMLMSQKTQRLRQETAVVK